MQIVIDLKDVLAIIGIIILGIIFGFIHLIIKNKNANSKHNSSNNCS